MVCCLQLYVYIRAQQFSFSMDLNDKIKQILVDKSISPSHFADEIGVQRSSISHILAGRNRPSLDIVQKIIRRYPDLGMEWILEDEDAIETMSNISSPIEMKNRLQNVPDIPTKRNGSESPVRKESTVDQVHENPTHTINSFSTEKIVERILIFYTDGTFKQYRPDIN